MEPKEKIEEHIRQEQWKTREKPLPVKNNSQYLKLLLLQNTWHVHPEFWNDSAELFVEVLVFPPMEILAGNSSSPSLFPEILSGPNYKIYRGTFTETEQFMATLSREGFIELGILFLFPFILGILPLLRGLGKGIPAQIFPRWLPGILMFLWIYWLIYTLQSNVFSAFEFLFALQWSGISLYLMGLLSFTLLRSSIFYAYLEQEKRRWAEYFTVLLKGYAVLSLPLGLYLLLFPFSTSEIYQILTFIGIFLGSLIAGPVLIRKFFSGVALKDSAVLQTIRQVEERTGIGFRGIFTYEGFPQKVMNAFVTGWIPGWHYLFLSKELMRHLTEEEIASVVAHEVAHIRQKHNFWLAGYLIPVLTGLYMLVDFWQLTGREWALLLYLILGLSGFFLISRYMEKRADQYAFSFFGEVYRSALIKLGGQEEEKATLRPMFFATHPPIAERLRLLKYPNR